MRGLRPRFRGAASDDSAQRKKMSADQLPCTTRFNGLNTSISILPQPVGTWKWQQTRNYPSNQPKSSLPCQSSSTFIPSTTLNTIGQMNVSLMRAMLWA